MTTDSKPAPAAPQSEATPVHRRGMGGIIGDPSAVPVVASDDELPPVPAHALRPESLRRRFASPPIWSPEVQAEHRFGTRAPAHASVLVPLVLRQELTVLLTERTAHLTDHPGQISFPGGRAEPGDPDAVATALREAEEEIGLPPHSVDVLGAMPTYTTGTGFIVTPVVGLIPPDLPLRPDPQEVADMFEVPLAFLMNPAHHRRHAVDLGEVQREFLSMPWEGPSLGGQTSRHYFIWGATADMLRNLYRLLAA